MVCWTPSLGEKAKKSPYPPRKTVRSLSRKFMPKRGARLSFSCGRLPGNHGRKRSFSECALLSKSYRAPRFNVSFLLTFQSSCNQPAKRCRTTLYWCSVSEVEWKTKRVMEASGARFQVEASFHTGKSDSRLAGGGPASA